ncbi:MAG: hypothetical protein GY940_29340 [bacterium]|nr:hypothetical protein [bacterium]
MVLSPVQAEDTACDVSNPQYRPVNPCPIHYTQPDGSQLTIYLRGR